MTPKKIIAALTATAYLATSPAFTPAHAKMVYVTERVGADCECKEKPVPFMTPNDKKGGFSKKVKGFFPSDTGKAVMIIGGALLIAGVASFIHNRNDDRRDRRRERAAARQGGADFVPPDTNPDTEINDDPSAGSSPIAITDEDTAITVDVLRLENSTEGENLTLTRITASPLHGTAVINNDGTITYTPDANYVGPDNLVYEIRDGQGAVAIDDMAIQVQPVNDSPIASDDFGTTSRDTPIALDVLANDSDADGDTVSIGRIASSPSNGAATIADGKIVYTPNPEYVGPDGLVYDISDGHGGIDTASANIQVEACLGVIASVLCPGTDAASANIQAEASNINDDSLFSFVGNGIAFTSRGARINLIEVAKNALKQANLLQDAEEQSVTADFNSYIPPSIQKDEPALYLEGGARKDQEFLTLRLSLSF
jgi:hypothetical protein